MFGLGDISGGSGGLSGGSSESSASNNLNQRFGNISFGSNSEDRQLKTIVTAVAVVAVAFVLVTVMKK